MRGSQMLGGNPMGDRYGFRYWRVRLFAMTALVALQRILFRREPPLLLEHTWRRRVEAESMYAQVKGAAFVWSVLHEQVLTVLSFAGAPPYE